VASLPLLGHPPPTPQYSGYLDATAGCDTTVNGNTCQIHYWMALAEGDDWESKPVVLFLNGGPGASSLVGFLQEVGPLLINATGGLMENPYSWNKVANLFVLESPVGVGFSYCAAQKEGGLCRNTDKFTASASRAALVDFFHTKFPELQTNDFFISGESYAGVYIPTLTYEILEYNHQNPTTPINLRGIAVGDPCTDNNAQHESMDPIWYAHKYGLVDEAVYDVLRNKCHVHFISAMEGDPNESLLAHPQHYHYPRTSAATAANDRDDAACTMAIRKYKLSTSHSISGKWVDRFVDRFSLFAPVTDVVDLAMTDYLNRPDVQAALHVTEAPVTNWTMHGTKENFEYTKEYDACNHFADNDAVSMIDFYRKIVPELDIAWIYNGDTDPAVTYEGTRTAVKRIGFPEIDGGGYRPWFYNHTAAPLSVLMEKAVMFGPDLLAQDTGAQFGGEVVNYEHNLAFLTVHGSGHMVPQFRPQAALHMISKLVQYEQLLSPLLPRNATLAAMTEVEFSKAMDEWTESAKAAPFVAESPVAVKG